MFSSAITLANPLQVELTPPLDLGPSSPTKASLVAYPKVTASEEPLRSPQAGPLDTLLLAESADPSWGGLAPVLSASPRDLMGGTST